MKITVSAIEKKQNDIIVTCKFDTGTLKGIWKGKTFPVLNLAYHVEFTFDDIDINHVKKIHDNQETISVDLKNDDVYFTGICETYDGEIHFIRFENGWLQMIYISENGQSIQPNDNILFWMKYSQIQIFPYNIY